VFNSVAVTILLLVTRSWWLVTLVLAVVIAINVYSCVRLHRLPAAAL
jgi:hypothetical protein